MSDRRQDKSQRLPGDIHQRVDRVEEYLAETAAEVREATRDFVQEVKKDVGHIKVDVSRSPRGKDSPKKGSLFMDKLENLKKLSPTKADVVASMNKLKNMWKYRHSTASDDGQVDLGEYSSEDEEEEDWEEILLKPIDVILEDYAHLEWTEAPDYLLRELPVHSLRQLPITHGRKLFLILTGPGYAFMVNISNWVLAGTVFFMYFLLVGFGSLVYFTFVITGVLPRPALGSWGSIFKLEFEALKLFLRLEWEACLDYRVRKPRIAELVTTTDREHKKRILATVVTTVLDNIRDDINGSIRYKEVASTVSAGSVIVCATLYGLFIFSTFMTTHMDFAQMNTKYFDGLAIILPFLLAEELAVFLARGTLVIKWFAVFLHENTVVQMLMEKKEDDEASKSEFRNDARSMCKAIGVGAWDMTGIASAMTAIWTIFFLYQSYYVDQKSQGLEPGPHGLADTMFWFMVLYSMVIIVLCYLPFTSWFGGAPESDEKYLAMLKSCQTFLIMNRLSVVQQEISTAIRKEYARARGVPIGQHVSSEEKRVLRSFRGGILKTLSSEDYVSYVLYSICMTLVDFESADGENTFYKHSIKKLRLRGSYVHCAKLEIPIDKLQEVEIALFDDQKDTNSEPDVVDASDKVAEKPQGAIIESLYKIDVLDTQVGESFVDKRVYELSQLIENPAVRDIAIYRNPFTNQVVLGLELKTMERKDKGKSTIMLASIYLMGITVSDSDGDHFEIGNGAIFLRGAGLEKKTLKLEGVDALFEKVAGRVLPRYVKRCRLASGHEKELFAQADDFIRGSIQSPPSYRRQSTKPEQVVRTGSASHLKPSEYMTAKTTTESNAINRTGSGRELGSSASLKDNEASRNAEFASGRIESDPALRAVVDAASMRRIHSGNSLPRQS